MRHLAPLHLVNVTHDIVLRELAALGGSAVLAVQDGLAILVNLQLGDNNVRGLDAEVNGLAVSLILGEASNVDDVAPTVNGGDLALTVLVGPADNEHLVILADGHRAHIVLVLQLLGEVGGHDFPAHAGGLPVTPTAIPHTKLLHPTVKPAQKSEYPV